jgi:UDP-2,3-diacylglucosamine pyrophosphatase LpxH
MSVKRKPGIAWSETEVEALHNLLRQNPNETYDFYARQMESQFAGKYTADSIRKQLKKSNVVYLNQKNAEPQDINELLDILASAQKKLQEFDDRQTEVTIRIEDDKPIGLLFSGDWHVGGLYTDHEAMRRDFACFNDTDGLYVIGMGDYADNYITRSHAGGMFEQIINADKQREIVEHFIDQLADKLLVLIKGNHDNWELKETGEDFVKYLARKVSVPYLWYGGEITLQHGEAEYKIHAHHSYRFNSSLNTTNSQRHLFGSTHADIIALGHLHYNETHAKTSGGKDTIWIRTGSYKLTDDYSQWIGGLKSDPRSPMVVIYPDAKRVIPFRDYRDGIEYLKMVRA